MINLIYVVSIAEIRVLLSHGREPKNYSHFEHCVNAVSRKCEYGVLEITSDTKVLLSHESQTSDLTKDFCFTRDFQNPILTFPHSQHWHC